MKSQKPLSRKENIVVQELEGEVLVYDLGNNKAVCLNETSSLIWQACDGNRTPAEISSFISKKLNTPASEDLVWLALDQLKNENLIENGNDLPNHFAGISRRDAIKKVGLSTLLALPVIVAVTSPAAASAGSLCGPTAGASCTCPGLNPANTAVGPGGVFCTNSPQCGGNNAVCQCLIPAGTTGVGGDYSGGTCIERYA